jgi:hypothetical protein
MEVDRQVERVRHLLDAAAGSKRVTGDLLADSSEPHAPTVIDAATPAHVALILSSLSDDDILNQLLNDALHAPD